MLAHPRVAPVARGAAVAVALTLLASAAHATPSMRVVYQRGQSVEHCPDEAALRGAVEQRLGYDPFFPWADRTIVVRRRDDP
jgi:hypothetical protein